MRGNFIGMGSRAAANVKAGLVLGVLWACLGGGTIQDSGLCGAGEGGARLGPHPQVQAILQEELSGFPLFVRGDANRDGVLTVMDGIVILEALFEGGSNLTCPDAADVDDDGFVDISDSIALLRFLFAGGLAPPAPCLCAGPDPTPDQLGCE